MKNHIDAYNGKDFRNSGSSGCLDIAADFSAESVAEIQVDVKAGRSIFQSAKMCGDGDQVDELELAEQDLQDPAGTFVFVSADRQAVLERRLRKGAAILHYSGTFTLYRNDKGVSPEDIAAYNALKSKKFVDDNTSLYNAIYESMNGQIDRLEADIRTINTEFKTKVAVVNTLFTNRITDMIAYLEKIQAIIGTLPVRTNDALTENVIKTAYAAFETNGIPISALIYLNKYVTLTSKNKAYPFLRFSLEDYKTLAVQITAAAATMRSMRPVRIPEDFFSHLTQKEGYTETVDTLLESFFDPSLLTPDILTALKLPEPDQADQDTVTQFIEADRIFSEISVTKRTKDEIESHKVLLRSALSASTSLRTQLNIHFSTLTSVAAAGGGSRQIGGARPEPDVLDKVLEVLKEASIFFNQRNLELENDVITINDDDGKMTVAEIKPVRKSFLSVIDSISPSDAATHAGDLLNRLNEIPVGDPTIEFIKLLLNPFNDDKYGYINKNHPIAKEVSYEFITKKYAETPQDYHLGTTEELGVVARKKEREEYSSFYSMFPDEANLIYNKDGIAKSFNDWLEDNNQVSEYFRAAYYAQRYGIVTLAVLNDLVENDMTATGSLLKGFIVTGTTVYVGSIKKINLYDKWEMIPFRLEAIFVGVIRGQISIESIRLLIGGKRKNRKTRRRNNKHAKRITRRRKH